MKDDIRKSLIFGIILLVLTMGLVNIQTGVGKKNIAPQEISTDGDNVLANMTVAWDSFFATFNVNNLQPKVGINQSNTVDFYFPEVNGTLQMNFTVVCKHRLEHRVIIPRFTRVYLSISYNESYIFRRESNNTRCRSLLWEYMNFTVEPDDQLMNLTTHGNNLTLTVEVGAYGFPFGFNGITMFMDDITVHPFIMRP